MTKVLKKLDNAGSLWMVFERFCQIDLHPERVFNLEMGYLFEELVRHFSGISNEPAGEHFTLREVVRLMVDLLLANDEEMSSTKKGSTWYFGMKAHVGVDAERGVTHSLETSTARVHEI
ncbi:hypothetical protein EV656_1294 [Rhodovulum adriaticum]|uniref:Uncharacterized protein n=1 Tax=Rhodovulum adriaticum TaxID=35804 RepID=A0A4R2NE29_RHOAD|nr:hypothetical protein [Rhodovulum adriaticum]TCP19539.1 hypothetical protein EV656_1294 [Rhodovulum adriaticum]